MEKIYLISKNPIFIQKLKLFFTEAQTVCADGPLQAVDGRIILDTDTCPEVHSDKCLRIGNGGDLPYPFSFAELRRAMQTDKPMPEHPLVLLTDGTGVMLHGRRVSLTEVEMKLFYALYSSEGMIGREELLHRVWGDDADGGVLNVYIHYLRTKLETEGERIIIAARGKGYGISEKYRRRCDADAD